MNKSIFDPKRQTSQEKFKKLQDPSAVQTVLSADHRNRKTKLSFPKHMAMIPTGIHDLQWTTSNAKSCRSWKDAKKRTSQTMIGPEHSQSC